MKKYHAMAKSGEMEYPTRTYVDGMERERRDPLRPKRFLERLAEYEDVDKLREEIR